MRGGKHQSSFAAWNHFAITRRGECLRVGPLIDEFCQGSPTANHVRIRCGTFAPDRMNDEREPLPDMATNSQQSACDHSPNVLIQPCTGKDYDLAWPCAQTTRMKKDSPNEGSGLRHSIWYSDISSNLSRRFGSSKRHSGSNTKLHRACGVTRTP